MNNTGIQVAYSADLQLQGVFRRQAYSSGLPRLVWPFMVRHLDNQVKSQPLGNDLRRDIPNPP